MDALQRAAASAESARSSAYNANAAAQQLRGRVAKLENDKQQLITLMMEAGGRIASLESSLQQLTDTVNDLLERLGQ